MRKHHVLYAVQATIPRQARCYATKTTRFNAAVIGGGITGMTAAWRLCQDPNCTKVTLYEKSPRLGGWLQSEKVKVKGGHVVFEYGPRTVRSSVNTSMPIVDLLFSLGMEDEILFHDKDTPAATNRFIYYPDRLVRLPGKRSGPGGKFSIWEALSTICREPLFKGFLLALAREAFIPPPPEEDDESVGSFVSRRLNKGAAENIASAICHGIYAGDVHKLSRDVMLPIPSHFEIQGYSSIGAILTSIFDSTRPVPSDPLLAQFSADHQRPSEHFPSIAQLTKSASVMTVKDGLGGITSRFTQKFKNEPKIQVITEAQINSIKLGDDDKIIVTSKNDKIKEPQAFDRVIATVPPAALNNMFEAGYPKGSVQKPTKTMKHLRNHNYAVNVMVINLYYDKPDLIPYRGFGYLIPQSVPLEQNPERALGVIFGSESSQGQDTAPGTKLTIMMGGHWWDNWLDSDIPSADEAIAMSQRLLKRHLGIDEIPAVSRARFQRQAVPQYTVGHIERMEELSHDVRREFNARLTLAGNWYGLNGVGLTSCVTQAYLAASYGVGSFPDPPRKEDAREMEGLMREKVGGVVGHPHYYLYLQKGLHSIPND